MAKSEMGCFQHGVGLQYSTNTTKVYNSDCEHGFQGKAAGQKCDLVDSIGNFHGSDTNALQHSVLK